MKLLFNEGYGIRTLFGSSISEGDYCITIVTSQSGSWRAYPGKFHEGKIYTSGIDRNYKWIRKEIAVCVIPENYLSSDELDLIEANINSPSRDVGDNADIINKAIRITRG